jgi:cytochrome c biogenesis protein CcdA
MNGLDITRWVFAVIFGLIWLVCAVGNLGSIISAARRHGSTSLILLFGGGVLGVIAVLVCPVPGLWVWCWAPALLDIGTLPALIAMAFGGAFCKRTNEPKTNDRNA